MKAVLISIRPKWCELIASGKKTIEVRKTRPKIETPFKCYIYCTHDNHKNALHLYVNSGYGRKDIGVIGHWRSGKDVVDVNQHLPAYRYNAYLAEGKVIGEFVCDKVVRTCGWRLRGDTQQCAKRTVAEAELPKLACLAIDEIVDYAGSENREVVGWHISDLKIYDKPKELGNFWKADKCSYATESGCTYKYHCFSAGQTQRCGETLTRPPQSWCYVEELP